MAKRATHPLEKTLELVLNLCNVAIFGLILYGTAVHRNRSRHVKVMMGCFVLDLALLLAVEFGGSGSAVGRAVNEVGDGRPSTMLVVHLIFAITALLLWFVQIYQGSKILKGDRSLLPKHKMFAGIFLVCRFGNVATAFFL